MLRARGCEDRIVALFEHLDWGSISGSLSDRIQWLEEHSPSDLGWDWLAKEVEEFRSAAAAAAGERVIWIAPRSASEQAGLFWYLHHFGMAAAAMIVADFPPGEAWRGEAPLGLGELGTEQVSHVLEVRPPRPFDEARFPADRWAQLMDESALLRIVEDGRLQSAPPDCFDQLVLKCTPSEWTRWYRVVGQTMADAMDEGHKVDDNFLIWRIAELVNRSLLELDGDLAIRGKPEEAAKLRRV